MSQNVWISFCGSYQLVPKERSTAFPIIHLQCDRLAVLFSEEGWVMGAGREEEMHQRMSKSKWLPGLKVWCPTTPWTAQELEALNLALENKTSRVLYALVLATREQSSTWVRKAVC